MDESGYIDKATWVAISPIVNLKTNSATILSSTRADPGHWTNEMKKEAFDVKIRTARSGELLEMNMSKMKQILQKNGIGDEDEKLSKMFLDEMDKDKKSLGEKSYDEMTKEEAEKFNIKSLVNLKQRDLNALFKESLINKRILDASFSRVCLDCRLLPVTEHLKCKHVHLRFSRLKSVDKQEDLTEGMDIQQMLLENYGLDVGDVSCAFPDYLLKPFFDTGNWYCKKNMNDYINTEVYGTTPVCYGVFIDPNAGGSNYTAFCGTKKMKNQVNIISWLDFGDTQTPEAFEEFIFKNTFDFITKVRKDHTEAPVVIFMESQSSWDASNINKELELRKMKDPLTYKNVIVACDKQKLKNGESGRHGVRMTSKRMNEMYRQFKIAMKYHIVVMDSNIGTSNQSGIKIVLDELMSEMKRFRTVFIGLSKKYNAKGEKKSKMSGKVALSNGDYLNDDMVIVLLMSVVWLTWFFTEDEYSDQRNKANLDF